MARAKRRTQQAVTIGDVARQAGVSAMTVSRVMNREDAVRQGTREKVLRAVKALNYQPNPAARRLAKGADVHIGLIYANPSDAYLGRFLQGALGAAQRSDNHLIVDICAEDTAAEYVASALRLAKAKIAGVILPPPTSGSDEILSVFDELDIPVATVANGGEARKPMDINIDDEAAAAAMTQHLLDLGHRRIGFVRGPMDQAASKLREQGFRKCMAAAGQSVSDELIVEGQFTYRSGVDAAERLLQLNERPTAIFASNDDMAAAAIGVAHRQGLAVPEYLSVVGFDNSPTALSVWPELTTVEQPVSAMAAAAFDLVLSKVDMHADSGKSEPVKRVHPCTLIERQSSGPCKKSD